MHILYLPTLNIQKFKKESILSWNYDYSFGALVLIEVIFDNNIQTNLIIILWGSNWCFYINVGLF